MLGRCVDSAGVGATEHRDRSERSGSSGLGGMLVWQVGGTKVVRGVFERSVCLVFRGLQN